MAGQSKAINRLEKAEAYWSLDKIVKYLLISFVGCGATYFVLKKGLTNVALYNILPAKYQGEIVQRIIKIFYGITTGVAGYQILNASMKSERLGSTFDKVGSYSLGFIIYDLLATYLTGGNRDNLLQQATVNLPWYGNSLITGKGRYYSGIAYMSGFSDAFENLFWLLDKTGQISSKPTLRKAMSLIQLLLFVVFKLGLFGFLSGHYVKASCFPVDFHSCFLSLMLVLSNHSNLKNLKNLWKELK
eukprot:gene11746-5084_t